MGIRTTSRLISTALELDREQWKRMFGGKSASCNLSVWPTRYAGVQDFLQQSINNPHNEAEFRSRINAGKGPSGGGRTTDAWAIFADSRQLPDENIPKELQKGESGGSYNWPNGLMGPEACKRLHAMGITKTSQLIHYALTHDIDDFHAQFGGSLSVFGNRYAGAYLYLVRCVTSNPENFADYQRRLAKGGDLGPAPSVSAQKGLHSLRSQFRRCHIPEDAGFTLILFAFALLAGAIVQHSVKSPIAIALVLSSGLFFVTGQSLGFCICVASYAVFAHIVTTLIASSIMAHVLFFVCVYICVAHNHNIPPSFIPSLLRHL
jgi:hypothetical protein